MTPINHNTGIHHYRKPTLLFFLRAPSPSRVPCYAAGRVAVYPEYPRSTRTPRAASNAAREGASNAEGERPLT